MKIVYAVATVIALMSLVQFERPVRAQEPARTPIAQERAPVAPDPANVTTTVVFQADNPGAAGEQAQKKIDDAMKKLEDLARRQQELAAQQPTGDEESAQQRYQAEVLRREAQVIQVQRELQRLQETLHDMSREVSPRSDHSQSVADVEVAQDQLQDVMRQLQSMRIAQIADRQMSDLLNLAERLVGEQQRF